MDITLGFSQLKSIAQVLSGNSKGAIETQKNFFKLCPGVSQCTSLVQFLSGDEKGAMETQLAFLKVASGMADSVPVVGHVKGVVHLICGDKEGGSNALNAATHSVGVMAGGATGFLVGGPAGAAVGGAMGGACADVIISAVEGATGDDADGYGFVGKIKEIIKDPTDGGNYVDLVGGVLVDGVTGYKTGSGIGKKIENVVEKRNFAKVVGNEAAANDMINAGESLRKIKTKHRTPQVMTKVKDHKTGKTVTGRNQRMRQVPIEHGPTELQKRVPGAKQVLSRSVKTCAEHEAYHIAISARPDALPDDFTSFTIRVDHKTNKIVTVQGCDNCKQYKNAMGTIYTDLIPETTVPITIGAFETCKDIGAPFLVPRFNNIPLRHSHSDSDSDSDSE